VYPQECLPGHRDACRDREAGPFRGAAGPGAGAAALVRRTGGGIIPSQAQAANQLGLTTQVPARNVFHTSSGKTRRVRVGNQTIELRRAEARRSPPGRSDGTEAVLQGLMFVSEGYVTPEIVAKVRGASVRSCAHAWRTRRPGCTPHCGRSLGRMGRRDEERTGQ
jgi:hypothetical protein